MQYNFPFFQERKHFSSLKKLKKGIKTSINQKTSHNHEMGKFLRSKLLQQPSSEQNSSSKKYSGLCLPFGFLSLVIFAKEKILTFPSANFSPNQSQFAVVLCFFSPTVKETFSL